MTEFERGRKKGLEEAEQNILKFLQASLHRATTAFQSFSEYYEAEHLDRDLILKKECAARAHELSGALLVIRAWFLKAKPHGRRISHKSHKTKKAISH